MWKSKATYVEYAKVYDTFKGDRTANVSLVQELIQKHHPGSQTVLDLACGTGSITEGLAVSYSLYGLDKSKHMLKIAKQRLPHIAFFRANMTNFKIDQKFDVICSLHNSMNHLLSLKQLAKTFEAVTAHLLPGGIFIFDINPLQKMNELVRLGTGTIQVGDDYITTEVTQKSTQNNLYNWELQIFRRQRDGKFRMKKETISIRAHSSLEIKQVAEGKLILLDYFILEQAIMADDRGRAYYIFQKPK